MRRARWLTRLPAPSRASILFLLGLVASTAGVAVGLVVLVRASNPAAGADGIERYIPLAFGTTHLYAVKQEGSPVRWKSIQVKGPAFVGLDSDGQIGLLAETRDFDGSLAPVGAPTSLYLLRDGDSLYFTGSRFGRNSVTESPRREIFTVPIEPGARKEWTADGDVPAFFSTSTTVETLGFETIDVMGKQRRDCVRSRTTSRFLDSNAVEHLQTTEDWVCPGLGTVRSIEDAPTVQYHREETLVAFRGPGGDEGAAVGPLATPPPAASTGTPPAAAWTIDRRTRSDLAPLAAGDFVYFAESDGTLTATDEATGDIAWQLTVDRPITIQPVVAGNVLAVSDRTRVLWGFDLATGLARWSRPLDDFPTSPPISVDGTIVLSIETGEIIGIDAASGAIRWRTHADGPVLAAPAVSEFGVAVAYADGGLAMIDPADGAVKWSRDLDGQPGNPSVADGYVAVTIDQAEVRAFDAQDGRLVFTATTDDRPVSDPVIGDGAVFAVAADVLSAVEIRTGERRWRTSTGPTSWPPMFSAGAVHVLTDSGALVSIEASSGAVASRRELIPGTSTDLLVTPTLDGDRVLTGGGGGSPWIHTTYRSVPLAPGSTPASISFDPTLTDLPAGPWPRVAQSDGGTVLLSDDNNLRLESPRGVLRDLYVTSGRSPVLLAAGGTAVLEEGRDAVGVALDGSGVRWRYDLGGEFLLNVAIDRDSFYAMTADARLVAVDLSTGRPRWERPLPGPSYAPPVVDGEGGILVSSAGKVSRLDAKTGIVAWSTPPDAFGRIAVLDGVVFFASLASSRPGFTALSLATGRELWNAGEGFGITVGAGDGLALAITNDSLLVAYDLQGGAERWSVPVSSDVLDDIVVRDALVYLAETGRSEDIGQRESIVRVFDSHGGRFLGSLEPPGTSFSPFLALVESPERLILPSFQLNPVLIEFIAERHGGDVEQ